MPKLDLTDMVAGTFFLNQEKALKRIFQAREKGDFSKARQYALEALEKFPNDYDIAMQAIQASLELKDYPQAANLIKNAYRRHPQHREEIFECARNAFAASSSTLIGGFMVETLEKSRDLEGIASLLSSAPESFLGELTKRAETRAQNLASEGQDHSTLYGENAMLLGVLYREAKAYEKSICMFEKALEILPNDSKPIGAALLQFERELSDSSLGAFCLGLASMNLEHFDKAEARFFQSLERATPPLEKILSCIEGRMDKFPNGLLLQGEALVRAGKIQEGVSAIREYLQADGASASSAQIPRKERCRRAASRLTILPQDIFSKLPLALLYADCAAELGSMKDAVAALEESLEQDPARSQEIIRWLESQEAISPSAPRALMLARLYAQSGRIEDTLRAGRAAAEADETSIGKLLESLKPFYEGKEEPKLLMLVAELRARLGDRESAEEILGLLRRKEVLPAEELVHLAHEIMKRCGATLPAVAATVDVALSKGTVEEVVPCVVSFCRERPEEHEAFAQELAELSHEDENRWKLIEKLLDAASKQEELSQPLRTVFAMARLFSGEIERAVFEFDQLMMTKIGLRENVIDIYRRALERYEGSAMLHLALFHLYKEEQSFVEAAHHLARTLELDPLQIRDVMEQFDKLVEREPANVRIWDEMLRTVVSMHRTSLAAEIMNRAVAALPTSAAAGLQLYGAKISAAEGAWDEALRYLSTALEGEKPDLSAIESELRRFIERFPLDGRAYFLLGETLIRLGSEREGTRALRRSIELLPELSPSVKEALERFMPLSIEPWLLSGLLGEIAWRDAKHEEAIRHFASALKGPKESIADLADSIANLRSSEPEDSRLAVIHARALAAEERYVETVSLLEDLLSKAPEAKPDAADILHSIIEVQPTQIEANALIARMSLDAEDKQHSKEALMRLFANENSDPRHLVSLLRPFLTAHEDDASFLARYGALEALVDSQESALIHMRRALAGEPKLADEILSALDRATWEQKHSFARELLACDCLIAAGRFSEAFESIKALGKNRESATGELESRIETLISRDPRREYFSFAAWLLSKAGKLRDAEALIERGKSMLDTHDSEDLAIELAELLYAAGEIDRARREFARALESASDRYSIYQRIERSYESRIENEIERLYREAKEEPGRDSVAKLVDLLSVIGRNSEALEIINLGSIDSTTRKYLLGRIYISMDRPILACGALAGASAECSNDCELKSKILYLEGIARERTGDFGRAAAIFTALASEGKYWDSSDRASRNYGRFLAEFCEEPAWTLEKTESL